MTDHPDLSHAAAPTLLATPDWVKAHLDAPDVRLLDVRLPESYAEGHLPGAYYVSLNDLRHTQHGIEGMLIAPEDFGAVMARLGIGPQTMVIAYDDNFGLTASRVVWSLLRYGHRQVALLDGGWEAWEALAYPISTDSPPPIAPVAAFVSRPADDTLANFDWVRTHLDAAEVVLLDVRGPSEVEKGRIPGAVAWNWENGIGLERTFRDADEVRAELAQIGVTPDKEIATYCQTGVRAAHTYVLLRELGFTRVRMYDGSWFEWSFRQGQGSHAAH
jgi:thiosulfate/3-mercaptopyruvate sulfurtransferase